MQQQTIRPLDGLQFTLLPDVPDDASNAGTQPVAEAKQPEPVVVEPPRPKLNDIFTRFTQATSDIDRIASVQQEFERSLLGSSLTDTPRQQDLRDIAQKAVNSLVCRAERQFAPSGGTLSISRSEVLEATGQDDWDEDYRRHRYIEKKDVKVPVDLDKIWAYLEKKYGGDGGKIAGFRQMAEIVIDAFRLRDKDAVNRTSSAVVISRRVWGEKKEYGPNRGLYELHYNYRDSMNTLFRALMCFAEEAELDALAIALQPSRHQITGYDFAYAPRNKVTFPGLDIVMFKEKWEFRFSHDVAEKLLVFIGEYGSE